MFKKCKQCGKLIFFRSRLYREDYYCSKCVKIVQERDIELENKIKEQELEQEKKIKFEQKRIKNKIADKQLLEDLKKQNKKELEKILKKERKLKSKLLKKKENLDFKESITKKQTYNLFFDKDTIQKYENLLYIEADIKRILAIEWINGKKRIILNHEREIRRTKAGGFSAEKFQKFVDSKKKNTIDWFTELLDKQGVLKSKYDKIKVISKKEELKKELEIYLDKYLR